MRSFEAAPLTKRASPRAKESGFTRGKTCARKSGESLANSGSLPSVSLQMERTNSEWSDGERPRRMDVSS